MEQTDSCHKGECLGGWMKEGKGIIETHTRVYNT